MISDTERREIARKLREIERQTLCELTDGELIDFLVEAVGFNRYTNEDFDEGLLGRIADLIEPQLIDGDTSDGYHTFNELYHHRAVLFSVIVAKFADRAWKSKLHADGTMFNGMFIVGIETPDGQATYHYDVDPYWEMFRCKDVDHAPEWDGHTPDQAIERIGKLADLIDRPTCSIKRGYQTTWGVCSRCGALVNAERAVSTATEYLPTRYCPNCGAEVVE